MTLMQSQILLYGGEAWSTTTNDESMIQAAEIRTLRTNERKNKKRQDQK